MKLRDFASPPLKVAAVIVAVLLMQTLLFAAMDLFPYDEGSRLANQAERFADKFRKSHDQSATFLYTPRYGNDQTITVEVYKGQYCPNNHRVGHSPCLGGEVNVDTEKGRSGSGYALGIAAAVPHYLTITKAHGPIQLDFTKLDGVVQLVGLE